MTVGTARSRHRTPICEERERERGREREREWGRKEEEELGSSAPPLGVVKKRGEIVPRCFTQPCCCVRCVCGVALCLFCVGRTPLVMPYVGAPQRDPLIYKTKLLPHKARNENV